MQHDLESLLDLLELAKLEVQENLDLEPTQNDLEEKEKTTQWWCVAQNLVSQHFRFEKVKSL